MKISTLFVDEFYSMLSGWWSIIAQWFVFEQVEFGKKKKPYKLQ